MRLHGFFSVGGDGEEEGAVFKLFCILGGEHCFEFFDALLASTEGSPLLNATRFINEEVFCFKKVEDGHSFDTVIEGLWLIVLKGEVAQFDFFADEFFGVRKDVLKCVSFLGVFWKSSAVLHLLFPVTHILFCTPLALPRFESKVDATFLYAVRRARQCDTSEHEG